MNTDKFQWKRVGMIFSLYYPMIKWQIIWYPVLSLAVAGLMALGKCTGFLTVPITFGSLLLSVAYFLAPIALTRRDYRQVSNILPVTAAEKLAFLIIYFYVFTYIMVNVPCGVMQKAFPDYVPCYVMANPAMPEISIGAVGYASGFLSSFTTMSVCLWAMVSLKTSRAAGVVGAWLGFNFLLGLVGGAVGAVYALSHIEMFKDIDSVQGALGLTRMLKHLFIIVIPLSLILVGIFTTLLYKKLKTRGF